MSHASDDEPAGLNKLHPSERGIGPDKDQPYERFDGNWWSDPHQRYRAMLQCAYWTFVPHSKNHATRKIVTTVLMLTWASVTVGVAFGFAETGSYYTYMTLLVFSIVCSIWGFEMGLLDSMTKEDDDE